MGITIGQTAIFAILLTAMAMFIWGRIRYDLVAFGALLLATMLGLVPFGDAYVGLGSPAVVTVALVLILSKTIQDSGAIDRLAKPLVSVMDRPILFMTALIVVGALLSGFMNNVGALALLMPLALQAKIPPGMILMPLSFGTILGGLTTLIGTPPNLIVSSYRETLTGEAFGLFSFSPVGAVLAVAGVLFVILGGWRLIPNRDQSDDEGSTLFHVDDYVTEVRVEDGSVAEGKALFALEQEIEGEVTIIGLIRDGERLLGNLRLIQLHVGDIMLLRADTDALTELLALKGISLEADQASVEGHVTSDNVSLVEAVVTPGSVIEHRTPVAMRFRQRFGINLIAVAREGTPVQRRIGQVRFRPGDVVLLQGEPETLYSNMSQLGLLPLANRALRLGSKLSFMPLAFFAIAIGLTALGLFPVYVSFALAVVAIVASGHSSARSIYDAIDWPIIVLLAAMIPIGAALDSTGGTALIANAVAGLSDQFGPLILLTIILVVTMTLSDMMNNAATAVVMAPIAAQVAAALGLNADPFLMAVAVGASCAFLTPIGHQNNLLVMGPGGYRFGDYWRMGLPLEIVIVAIAVPMIALVWPLS